MLRLLVVTLSMLMVATPAIPPADAGGFGIRKGVRKAIRAPYRGVRRPVRRILPYRSLRRTLGIAVVATIGVVILSDLTARERKVIGRRTTRLVERDPELEVTDIYEPKKNGKQVKITASPSRPPDQWRDDAFFDVADENPAKADTGKKAAANSKTDESKQKNATKKEGVKLSELPADARCRKVSTELTVPANKKKKTPEKVDTNTAVLCKMSDGKWRPALP